MFNRPALFTLDLPALVAFHPGGAVIPLLYNNPPVRGGRTHQILNIAVHTLSFLRKFKNFHLTFFRKTLDVPRNTNGEGWDGYSHS